MRDTDILSSVAFGLASGEIRVVDCSATLGPNTPLTPVPGDNGKPSPPVKIHKISEYDKNGPFWAWNWLEIAEHAGTHFKAPNHAITGRARAQASTDTLSVQRVVGRANVLDFSKECEKDPGFLLTKPAIQNWESQFGPIESRDWVLFQTIGDQNDTAPEKPLTKPNTGPTFPGPTPEAVAYLVEKSILGWGSQCPTLDATEAMTMTPAYPAHHLFSEHGIPGLASLTNLHLLPPKGAILIAAPLKIAAGTGSPIRALALIAQGSPQ